MFSGWGGDCTGTDPSCLLSIDQAHSAVATFAPAKRLTLTKAGAGTLTLSGANLHTGLNTVTAGTLALGANNALVTGGVTVNGVDLATVDDDALRRRVTPHVGQQALGGVTQHDQIGGIEINQTERAAAAPSIRATTSWTARPCRPN